MHDDRRQLPLALGALGIVYGDLGTSPLYAIRETFESEHHRLAVNEVNVLGAVSIIFWTLLLIITIKYVAIVLRADNDGEGGILALTALVAPERADSQVKRRSVLVLLGLFGTALLYGDGMITPAISVLAAVEGFEVAASGFADWVVPISVVVLVALFSFQRRGTGVVGRVFGPIMLVWFATIAVLGMRWILEDPTIFRAINPVHAVDYFRANTFKGFLSMGSLFLVVTGGEALYADMGHFGRRPIRIGWLTVVMPALLISYFGTGALLLQEPDAIENAFFRLAPEWGVIPLAVLATAATVIASQALISGVFSITHQAINLGYAPRSHVRHTSSSERGQVYLARINWALMVACIGLVIGFGSSSALAGAFGLSVTGTMVITTLLFAALAREVWGWGRARTWTLCGLLLVVEGAFLAANMFKIPDGGWFPLVVAAVIFTLLTTWKTGRRLVSARLRRSRLSLDDFARQLTARPSSVVRVPGCGVYMFSAAGTAPPHMLANVRANGSLHATVYVVTVRTMDVPKVHPMRRVTTKEVGSGIHQVVLEYGFTEAQRVADDMQANDACDVRNAYWFVGRESVHSTSRVGMARWREVLFGAMARNATNVSSFFHLPPDRVSEVGIQVEI